MGPLGEERKYQGQSISNMKALFFVSLFVAKVALNFPNNFPILSKVQ